MKVGADSITAFGVIEDGVLRIKHRKTFDENIRALESTDVVISIEPVGKRRSIKQLRYYWGVVIDHLVNYFGWEPQVANEFVKSKFNGMPVQVVNQLTGEILEERWIGLTQKFLNKTEFNVRKEQIQSWAMTELGLFIPDPDEHYDVEEGDAL